jgi:hypothetical protein
MVRIKSKRIDKMTDLEKKIHKEVKEQLEELTEIARSYKTKGSYLSLVAETSVGYVILVYSKRTDRIIKIEYDLWISDDQTERKEIKL